jgi:hypothetical protein
MRTGIFSFTLAALVSTFCVAAFAAPVDNVRQERGPTSAPPADARAGIAAAPAARRTVPDLPARRIALPAPQRRDVVVLAAPRTGPLPIGIARDVAVPLRDIALRDLAWRTQPDGTRVARIEVASPGAAALRVALSLDRPAPGIVLRFAGAGTVVGQVTADEIAAASANGRSFWTPDLEGDVAVVEIEAAAGAQLHDLVLRIARVSHLVVGGRDLLAPGGPVARATGIGTAASCNVDLACTAPADAALADLAKSVARITFVDDSGRSYLCSAVLLNDTRSSNVPYLWTANHCVGSQTAAGSLNAYFFYAAQSCDSKVTPPFVQLAGGAKLLGRSQDNDWSIVRLNEAVPPGARLAAWQAATIPTGAAVVSLHHPSGDLVKSSRGTATGQFLIDEEGANGVYTEVVWTQGVTEGGSSGGPLATLAAAGHYEVRGGLFAGSSSCTAPRDPDYYSRFGAALPLMRQYLTPDAVDPDGRVAAVEFYHAGLDHYFLSTNPVEIDNLDSGRTVGWVRTGLRFLVFDRPQPGTSAVCRFYRAPAFGDSHFYSASEQECAQTAAAHPVDWVYESPSVFHAYLPNVTTGACPAGTVAVYRFFNSSTTNHRYTTERTLRDDMRLSPRWTAEGYGVGPYFPVMCALA